MATVALNYALRCAKNAFNIPKVDIPVVDSVFFLEGGGGYMLRLKAVDLPDDVSSASILVCEMNM